MSEAIEDVNDSALTMEPDGEISAVIDENTAAAIRKALYTPEVRAAQHRQLWTPDSGDAGCTAELDGQRCLLIAYHDDAVDSTPHLFSLDELSDIEVDDDGDKPSIEDVKAGLQGLSGGIATAQDVENAARAEEGLPPIDQELPLDFGPFNSDAALKAIFEKSAEVRVLQADFDRKKEAAKDAKGELDIAAKALVNIIESLKNRRTQALNPTQPFLADVSGDTKAAGCPWEVAHPGQHCPICEQAKAKLITVDVNSEVHPEHAGHAAIAEAARRKTLLEPLAAQLATVNLYVEVDELAGITAEDLAQLVAYVAEPSPIPPQILARCHVAAEPGSIMQVCQRCETNLRDETNRTEDKSDWYPVDARVGFDCEAYQPRDVEGVKEPDTEAPRKPRSHAKKRANKKTAPELERHAQATEGKKRTAPKKAGKKGKR